MTIIKATMIAVALAASQSVYADSTQFEGVAVIAAGAVNPPDPIESCNRAKRDAEKKAVKAGTKGLLSWERLSTDSDCSLKTQGAAGKGYIYIFAARGNFLK